MIPASLAAVMVLLGGCLQGPASPSGTQGCPEPPCGASPSSTPPSGTPKVLTNATLEALRFEDCTGAYLQVDFPEEWARPTLPDEFEPRGNSPATVGIGFHAYDCQRAVRADVVVPSVQLVYVLMAARPTNESWHKYGGGTYHLDVFAGSTEFSALVRDFGLPNRAATIQRDRTLLPDGSTHDRWLVSANTTEFEFTHAWENVAGNPNKTPASHWFQADGFRRIDIAPDWLAGGVAFGLKASTVSVRGPSQVAGVMHGAETVPTFGQTLYSFDETWELNQTVFR